MPERLTDEELRLLDRRDELYALDADERIPHAAQLILEKERDAIEQHFGDRLDSAIAIRMRERQEERERQAPQAEKAREARKPLVERINDCVKLLKSRLVEKIREAVSPAQKLYYSRRKEGLEVMKKELAHDKNLSRGQALGVAR